MKSYVFVGPHPDTLNPDGTPLAIDQVVEDVALDDAHNAFLVAEGWLIEQTPADRKAAAEAAKADAAAAAKAASQTPDSDPEA
jgi:hypothetical protein